MDRRVRIPLDEPLTVDLETASGNMNRIDNIVVQLDLSNRWIKALTVTGNYYSGAATAKEPEITATIHDLIIARVNVAAGTTAITQDMIEDTRMNDELCGWVCGAVQQISFAQITAQFDAFFAAYKADVTAEYAAYLQNIASLETQAQTRYDAWTKNSRHTNSSKRRRLKRGWNQSKIFWTETQPEICFC